MNNPKILFEDKNLAVLDKPANLVVHAVTEKDNQPTLVDYISKKWPEINKSIWQDKLRSGIVHRLDKDTSGIIIIAKNPKTQIFIQSQFKDKIIKKYYTLLCIGKTKDRGEIVTQTTRSSKLHNKQTMSLMSFSWQKGKSRQAITKYKTLKYYKYENYDLSLVEAQILTGRTHQIRNHFKFIDHPIVGDQMYTNKISKNISEQLKLTRQFLHSSTIEFNLPSGKFKKIKSELPLDLTQTLNKLKNVVLDLPRRQGGQARTIKFIT